jgi:hypothetical protein
MSGAGDTIKDNEKNWIVFILFTLFLSYMYRFLISDGYDHPLVNMLFKMILILSILVFFLHKTQIEEGKNEVMKQTNLFKYFRRKA